MSSARVCASEPIPDDWSEEIQEDFNSRGQIFRSPFDIDNDNNDENNDNAKDNGIPF